MFDFKRLSIRNKLTVIIMSSVLISLLALSSVFIVYEFQAQKHSLEEEFETTSRIIASQSAAALIFNDIDGLQENLENTRIHEQVVTACFYSQEKELLAKYESTELNTTCPNEPTVLLREFSSKLYSHSEPIEIDGEQVGLFYVQVSLEELYTQLSIYVTVVMLFILVVCFAAYVLSRHLQEFIARPLSNLSDTAARISKTNDYSIQAEKESDDEIGSVVDAFNDMLRKVKSQNEDILEYTVQLDKKVKERTGELDTANSELEKRNSELAVANKELEAFSYSVSHDLRSPLRAIDGFTLALEEDYAEDLDDMAKSYIKRARAAAQKMGDLISTLLQLSRVSRKELEIQPTNMSDLAEKVCQQLRDGDSTREVHISVQEGMQAAVDKQLMEAAFDNLIGNAWKYTGKEDKPVIEIGCLDDQGTQVYFVRDNGAGFDKTYSKDLFTAFKRLHGDDEFEGTGIGLATVARIIHRHHGDIWAKSELGEGAEFFFTLDDLRPQHHEANAESSNDNYRAS